MRKVFLLLLYIIQLNSYDVAAQTKPKPSPEDAAKFANNIEKLQVQEHVPRAPQILQSPNVASLGAYGEVPVSLFTGKPEINVDLHVLSEGNVSIPISLNYDATGVRPDVHPGWVGLNFNLSTNYAVVRTVRDGPDDFPNEQSERGQAGWINGPIRNSLNYGAADWTSVNKLKTIALNAGGLDIEPDEFGFNAPGLSGKFYLSHDGQWRVQCDRPVTVQPINIINYPPFNVPSWTGNPWNIGATPKYCPHLSGFIVTDENGTQYQFGGDNSFCEYSIDFFDQGKDTWVCNAWFLKSITRVTGQVIDFSYQRYDFVAQMYFSVYNKFARVDGGSWFSCENWSSLITDKGPYDGKLISPIYLSEISGDNFKVKFTSNPSNELPYTQDIFYQYETYLINNNKSKVDFLAFLQDCFYPTNNAPNTCDYNLPLSTYLSKLKWRKLDKIEIQNKSGVTIKEFGFTYNNVSTARLMLESVQEKSGTKVIPPYQFTYFTEGAYTLPGYGKSHTDHWGFNNGTLINVTSDFNSIGTYGTTYREPAALAQHLKLSSLASIKYPTGGVTKFIFEPHSFSKEVKLERWEGEDSYSTNKRAGGLRIKEIHSYDNVTGPVVSKKYYYLSTFNPASPDTSATVLSSGIVGGRAKYYWPDYMPLPDDASITVVEDIFSTQSVLPASENSMGSHIGYSQVIELSSTGGWTVSTFSNFDNGYRDNAPSGYIQPSSTPYQPYNSTAFKRGKAISVDQYFQNGNPVSKSVFQYTLVGSEAENVRSVKASSSYLCSTFNTVSEGTAYIIDVRKFFPSSETTQHYDQDNTALSTTKTITKTYWPNGQLYTIGQTDSKGRTLKTWYKYPPNSTVVPHPAMALANIIATPYEVFQYTGTEAAPAAIKLQTITFNSTSPYLPSKVESKLGASGPVTTDIEFTYDGRGNVSTYKEKNGIPVKLDYFGTGTNKTDLLQKRTLSDGGSIPQETAYDYKPLVGVSQISDPNAKIEKYDYDELGRLITVKNATDQAKASYCYNYAGQLTPCTNLAPTGSIGASGLTLIGIISPPLPVTLVDFEAVKVEKVSLLTWSTTSETNSERFDIERSADGKNWQKLGETPAQGSPAGGESTGLQNYSFTDKNPATGENLYRLKMIDDDSSFAYSRIRSVTFGAAAAAGNDEISLFPNPVTVGEKLNLSGENVDKIADIQFFDNSGKLALKSAAAKQINTSGLTSGLYIVQITYTDGSISTHRIVKQ